MLWMLAIYHDKGVTADSLLRVIDGEVEALRTTLLPSRRWRAPAPKMRSSLERRRGRVRRAGKLTCWRRSRSSIPIRPSNRLEAEFARAVTL
ncbi:MAG: hypothetical protein IPJ56_18230 [Gemmatimonadetes bacterium]|nr:hypothetical protein [Gemmatimonadota bacterium]